MGDPTNKRKGVQQLPYALVLLTGIREHSIGAHISHALH